MVTRTLSGPVTVSRDTLDRLSDLARDAGRVILRHYRDGVDVEHKEDRSPVTAADRDAHGVIVGALTAWDPSIPVISEEGEIPAWENRRDWDRFWLVDPLDGTKEFLSRNGEFTVNIALIEDGVPVLGVIYAPAPDLLYFAGRDVGAWKVSQGRGLQRISSAPPAPGAPLVVAESRSHPSAALEEYLATVNVGRRVQAGSSLKFCWVAEGRADIYPRLGPTMEWDVAAGDAIFRYSGRDGVRTSPLTYNTPDLRNTGFVIGLPTDGGTSGG
jgi:3'(2'), 5'-bisphosphate nucleotidase